MARWPQPVALVHMPAERGGAASLDGNKHLQVQPGEPGGRPIQESVAGCAYEIGQLQEWPRHLLTGLSSGFWADASMSESSGLAVAFRCRSDRCRYRLVVFRSAWPKRS